MSAPTIEQIVAQIRTALYGKDVRENIALGIETCYGDVEECLSDFEETEGMVAEVFNANAFYPADTLVINEDTSVNPAINKLYYLPVNHEIGVTWANTTKKEIKLSNVASQNRAYTNANTRYVNKGVYEIQQSDMEQGQWSYGTKSSSSASTHLNRIRTKNLIPVRSGMKINYTVKSGLQIYIGVVDFPGAGSSNFHALVSWTNGVGTGSVTCSYDGYMTFIVRNATNPDTTEIDVDDFTDTTVTISTYDKLISFDCLAVVPNGSNIDDIVENGFYFLNTEGYSYSGTLPSTDAGMLFSFLPYKRTSEGVRMQFFVANDDDVDYEIKYRSRKSTSGWTPWIKVANQYDLSQITDMFNAVYPFGDRYGDSSTSRTRTYSRNIASGETISVKVMKWTGNTPTAIKLYLSDDGTNYKQAAMVPSMDDWLEYTTTEAYTSFRIGIVCDSLSSAADIEVVVSPFHRILSKYQAVRNAPYIYGKSILLGGASIVQGYGGTGYAMDGTTIIDISGTPEGQSYSTGGLWKRNTNGYCWANLFKSLLESKYAAAVDNNGCAGTNINFWKKHYSDLIPSGYDLFIYSFSSNDRNYEPATVKQNIYDGLKVLRDRCRVLGTEIIAVSVPPASEGNESGKSTQTWQCNEFIKDACEKLGVRYFDLHNEMIKYYYTYGADSAGTFKSDGLHPNDSMYYVMYFCYCWLFDISPTTAYATPPAGHKTIQDEFNDVNAKIDGVVPTAEAVMGNPILTDKTPYIFRQTPAKSKRAKESQITGGTIAWNQHMPELSSSNYGALSATASYSNGKATYTASSTNSIFGFYLRQVECFSIKDHIYLVLAQIKSSASGKIDIGFDGNATVYDVTANTIMTLSSLKSPIDNDKSVIIYKRATGTTAGDTFEVSNYNCFDLTQMFGSDIADAIYALETANAGTGVAWFRSLFPNDYYAYDAGTLQSVQAKEKRTVGFNAWDEEWEAGSISDTGENTVDNRKIRSKNYIPVVPDETYFFYGASVRVLCYDASKSFISYQDANNSTFTTPYNCRYIRFHAWNAYGATYNHDICINISDPARDGTYEPYEEHTYPFDSSLTLRGIPKWANGSMYYDGDEYKADGTVTRRYGAVNLGLLTWQTTTLGSNAAFRCNPTNLKNHGSSRTTQGIIAKNYTMETSANDKTCCFYNDMFIIRDDAYSDTTAFKTAMSGIWLVYEITPTTESADPFNPIQITDPDGTEQYTEWGTRDVAVPVGHETEYLKDILSAVGDIPDAPSANGTYVLQVTVSSGVATYSWVSAT